MLKFKRWIPAIIVMLTIFIFSSTPSTELPSFGLLDMLVKKSGHMLGYGLLAISILFGLEFDLKKGWLAWLLAILYAFSDEFHQSFVPGRRSSLVDVFIFDGIGAAVGLGIATAWLRLRRSQKDTPV